MTETEYNVPDSSFRQEEGSGKCEICMEDLTRKRSMALQCGHSAHRTCLLNIFESNFSDDGEFPCPVCGIVSYANIACDERGEKIGMEVFGYGAPAQPTEYIVAQLLTNEPKYLLTLDKLIENTSDWLSNVSKQLKIDRVSGTKSDEYIQDMVDERTKLMRRISIFLKLQETHKDTKERIRVAAEEAMRQRAQNDDQKDKESRKDDAPFEGSKDTSTAHDSSTDLNCSICFEPLSRKRSATLNPCNHTFHESCIINWIDSKEEKTCCLCREVVTTTLNDQGEEIEESYPFEQRIEDHVQRKYILRGQICTKNIYYCAEQMQRLHKQKRIAIRDGKSREWIDDIDEEMEKMRKRCDATNRYHLFLHESKHLEHAASTTEISAIVEPSAVEIVRDPALSGENTAGPGAAAAVDSQESSSINDESNMSSGQRRRADENAESMSSNDEQHKRRRE